MAESFRPFEEDFLRITADIVWCTLTTVDRKGRPRSRVVHPIFTVADGQPVGWLLTGRTPVKQPRCRCRRPCNPGSSPPRRRATWQRRVPARRRGALSLTMWEDQDALATVERAQKAGNGPADGSLSRESQPTVRLAQVAAVF